MANAKVMPLICTEKGPRENANSQGQEAGGHFFHNSFILGVFVCLMEQG